MNNNDSGLPTPQTFSWYNWRLEPPKTECPVCQKQCSLSGMVTFVNETYDQLWKGCYTCIAKVLVDHPKTLQRLSTLEQKFEELNSRIRRSD